MALKFMKAADADLIKLFATPGRVYIATVKADGVAGGFLTDRFTSRTLKDFANRTVGEVFSHPTLRGFSGELAVGSLTDGATCRRTTSVVNSFSWNTSGEIPTLYAFDFVTEETQMLGYAQRFNLLFKKLESLPPELARYVTRIPESAVCRCLQDVLNFHEYVTGLGYEGTVLRRIDAPHKNGRATLREEGFLRIKDQLTDEAVVIGLEEAMENLNPALVNELGETYRTSHKENLSPKGMLGSFLCLWQGKTIRVSAGELTHKERRDIWETQGWVGRTITFRYMPGNMKDLPRFARYVARREGGM